MTTKAKAQPTYTELTRRIERELAKKVTDRETWNVVEAFWSYEGEALPGMFDRVEWLEGKMWEQHGWARRPEKFA